MQIDTRDVAKSVKSLLAAVGKKITVFYRIIHSLLAQIT